MTPAAISRPKATNSALMRQCRSNRRRLVAILQPDAVALPEHGVQDFPRALAIDFFSQQVHVRPQDVVAWCPLAPDVRLEVFAAHHMRRAPHQDLQYLPPDG